jgi:hypothetical protein
MTHDNTMGVELQNRIVRDAFTGFRLAMDVHFFSSVP